MRMNLMMVLFFVSSTVVAHTYGAIYHDDKNASIHL